MPRGGEKFKIEAVKDAVSPVLLLRVMDMPKKNSPSEKISYYFANLTPDKDTRLEWKWDEAGEYITWPDENGEPCKYYSIGFTFSSLERSTDNSIDSVTVRIDNIDMRWAVVANTYILNNTDVEIWEAFRDSLADGEDGAKLIFMGHIQSCVVGDTAIEATITPDFSLKKRAPRRMYWPADFPYIPSSKSSSSPLIVS